VLSFLPHELKHSMALFLLCLPDNKGTDTENMKALTKEGQQAIDEIARRYDLKVQSVETMVKAVISGNGTMAQFSIPELGGTGQWMRGGMTMVGDMFNQTLKSKVDKLCTELSDLVCTKVIFEEPAEVKPSAGSWPSVLAILLPVVHKIILNMLISGRLGVW
jgi:hypothetical protein